MKISISLISSDRFFSKAFTKHHQFVEDAEKELSVLSDSNKTVEIWFVDKDTGYCEVVKNSAKLVEIHLGRDLDFDYRPLSGSDVGAKIRSELSGLLSKSIKRMKAMEI